MKNHIRIGLLCAICFAVACVNDASIVERSTQDNETSLSIAEAQAFFEKQVGSSLTTRLQSDDKSQTLPPGDFSPQWQSARICQNKDIANVDVPILSQYRYMAFRSDVFNGTGKAYSVNITQKLVIAKNTKTNKLGYYIITLIPDKDYYASNKKGITDQFISCGTGGNYSGWVIYSIPEIKMPIAVKYYKDGKAEMNFVIPKLNGKSNAASKAFVRFINSIRFAKLQSIQTRSFGEDDYDSFGDWFMNEIWPDTDDGDSYTMEHDESGCYLQDQDGNRYDVPPGVGEDENENDWPDYPDYPDLDDSGQSGGDDDWSLGVAVHCPYCGTYLSSMLLEEWENGIYYCPRCKKYVSIFFG